jgi:tetratricopeptide (TPR) repeat protein
MLEKLLQNKIFIYTLIGLSIISLASAALLVSKKNFLNNRILQLQEAIKKMQEDATRLETEKEKITSENEKLQADSISYLSLNNDLRQEKEKLQTAVLEKQRSIEIKEVYLKRLSQKLNKLEGDSRKDKAVKEDKLTKERNELRKKMASLQSGLRKDKAVYYYNLAVAYTKAKLYDEALEAYEASLKLNPDNAEAHYNLGLLCADVKDNPPKAIEHYNRYLELMPNADDRQEVQALIKNLED